MHSFHKVVYKPDSQSTDEWIVIVGDLAAAEKWRGGDRYAFPSFPHLVMPPPPPPRTSISHQTPGQFSTPLLLLTSTSIPLVEVVDSFDVFHTGQGSQGVLVRASKQELENIFSTTNEDEIVQIVLEKGRIVSSNTPHQWAGTNDTRSGNYQTAHGANAGKAGHGGR
ncbi:RNA binding protein [Rhodotorula toruloides]|uniref:RNA binding protein n=1 Tax=Rhodotorula toruloides TaxID=5286 RepID=A0A511K7Z9_RHOTO|nr:RNA binding protein [Rhodotorula toruloides]